MTKFLFTLALIPAVLQAQTVAFQAPVDSQTRNGISVLTWGCTANPSSSIDVQGQNPDGTYYGIAYFAGFGCVPHVSSGHPGGRTILSACADAVWDPTGLLLSVTPFATGVGLAGYRLPCTP